MFIRFFFLAVGLLSQSLSSFDGYIPLDLKIDGTPFHLMDGVFRNGESSCQLSQFQLTGTSLIVQVHYSPAPNQTVQKTLTAALAAQKVSSTLTLGYNKSHSVGDFIRGINTENRHASQLFHWFPSDAIELASGESINLQVVFAKATKLVFPSNWDLEVKRDTHQTEVLMRCHFESQDPTQRVRYRLAVFDHPSVHTALDRACLFIDGNHQLRQVSKVTYAPEEPVFSEWRQRNGIAEAVPNYDSRVIDQTTVVPGMLMGPVGQVLNLDDFSNQYVTRAVEQTNILPDGEILYIPEPGKYQICSVTRFQRETPSEPVPQMRVVHPTLIEVLMLANSSVQGVFNPGSYYQLSQVSQTASSVSQVWRQLNSGDASRVIVTTNQAKGPFTTVDLSSAFKNYMMHVSPKMVLDVLEQFGVFRTSLSHTLQVKTAQRPPNEQWAISRQFVELVGMKAERVVNRVYFSADRLNLEGFTLTLYPHMLISLKGMKILRPQGPFTVQEIHFDPLNNMEAVDYLAGISGCVLKRFCCCASTTNPAEYAAKIAQFLSQNQVEHVTLAVGDYVFLVNPDFQPLVDLFLSRGDGTFHILSNHVRLKTLVHSTNYRVYTPEQTAKFLNHSWLALGGTILYNCQGEATLLREALFNRLLQQKTHIKSLDLSHTPFTTEECKQIIAMIPEMKFLETFAWHHSNYWTNTLVEIAKALARLEKLRSISLDMSFEGYAIRGYYASLYHFPAIDALATIGGNPTITLHDNSSPTFRRVVASAQSDMKSRFSSPERITFTYERS